MGMNGKPWTEAHTAVLRVLAGLFSDADIATVTGHASITVRKRREAAGLPAYQYQTSRYGSLLDLPKATLEAIKSVAGHLVAVPGAVDRPRHGRQLHR